MSRKNEDPSLLSSFSKQFDEFMENNKYTNQYLANLLGCDEGTIRKYRKGEFLPSHTSMKKISEIMKANYYDLMGYKDPSVEEDK